MICEGERGLPGPMGDASFPGPSGPKGLPGDVLFQNSNGDGQTKLFSELKGENGVPGFEVTGIFLRIVICSVVKISLKLYIFEVFKFLIISVI